MIWRSWIRKGIRMEIELVCTNNKLRRNRKKKWGKMMLKKKMFATGEFNIGIDSLHLTIQSFSKSGTVYCDANGSTRTSWDWLGGWYSMEKLIKQICITLAIAFIAFVLIQMIFFRVDLNKPTTTNSVDSIQADEKQ